MFALFDCVIESEWLLVTVHKSLCCLPECTGYYFFPPMMSDSDFVCVKPHQSNIFINCIHMRNRAGKKRPSNYHSFFDSFRLRLIDKQNRNIKKHEEVERRRQRQRPRLYSSFFLWWWKMWMRVFYSSIDHNLWPIYWTGHEDATKNPWKGDGDSVNKAVSNRWKWEILLGDGTLLWICDVNILQET